MLPSGRLSRSTLWGASCMYVQDISCDFSSGWPLILRVPARMCVCAPKYLSFLGILHGLSVISRQTGWSAFPTVSDVETRPTQRSRAMGRSEAWPDHVDAA